MKFLHIADVHLDSPFLGLSFLPSELFCQIKNAIQLSFEKAVNFAIDNDVDLVLLAGDTFDSIHPTPQSKIFFANQIKRLVDRQIQVVMVLGNHDYSQIDDLLLNESPYFKIIGSNEQIEQVDFMTKSQYKYRVVGFSYQHNHITEDIIAKYPPKSTSIYTIGLAHAGMKQSSVDQNNYAPFTLNEVKNLNYDYFALGHIHLRQVLSQEPWIVYSGNLQGRHVNEKDAKGFYFGQVDEQSQNTQLQFIDVSPIVWQTVDLILDEPFKSTTKLCAKIQNLLADNNLRPTLFTVNIIGAELLSDAQLDMLNDKSMYEELSNNLQYHSLLVKVYYKHRDFIALNATDRALFAKAAEEILTANHTCELASSLMKKSNIVTNNLQKEEYLSDIYELARVRLEQKLRGNNDEIN
ncbi:metallophosphoesterase family protein [Lactobacillus iners]|jgi:ser/thr phosphatase family protein|uniref:metallophosphoesterase family protein n=1 Tax=Lactobacillus iners TaxID=147802 RepID=UPI0001E5E0C5|nr:DNA repair exonuclease [Lactobacillus iners]EFO67539.1 Ser/Thr phosphatase family protein [Lactobacillus iners LactinV 09V1-c]EGC79755.1 Ser/Thr phosphatase family protein [Lactobacillus iners UPII 143-D]MCT7676814.1 DNA repair exonuclease [Lactobacillus iners]MCT7864308.1 DNA repair exonuclease [Lactobacillus iners]MCT7868804.1 DNA repair exonuclease [Lactobacillus iners]